jgi:hypothetical protein
MPLKEVATVQNTMNEIIRMIGAYVPNLIGALVILIIGWIAAFILYTLLRNILHRVNLNKKLVHWIGEEQQEREIDIEKGISKGVFYLLMLFILVGFFQTLGVTLITEPLNRLLNTVFEFAPKLIGAGALMLIAWIVASILRLVVSRTLSAAKFDERLERSLGIEEKKHIPLTKSLSDAVYWLIFLLFLPAVLNTLSMKGLLEPVQGMLNKILHFLPNVLTAVIIFAIGWFIARIIQQIAVNLLSALGVDTLSEKVGISSMLGRYRLSTLLGVILFILIIIPVLIAAFNTLALEAITTPASDMLNKILTALPSIFAAILVIGTAYILGRMIARLTTNLLEGIGFNNILIRIGLQKEQSQSKTSLSEIAGYLVLISIMFFAVLEASRLLGFEALANLVNQFMVFASHIIFGLIIFALGLFLANLAYQKVIESGTSQAGLLALASRITILVLASAIALRQMGLANEIINLAFGLLMGAIAVAIAIAFGIGGRDIAARKLEEWTQISKNRES